MSVGGSVSRSYAKTKGGDRYPLVGLLHGPYQQLKQQGADPSQLRAAQTFGPSSSWGTGYQLFANVERRLSNRWIVGGGTVFQKSQDYSPNNFFLYLRYSFEPWQGDLAKPPQPNTPYAEF